MTQSTERELSILGFMQWANIPYEASGKWAWPIAHDSMRIQVNKNYYHRYSTNDWGHLREFITELYPDYSQDKVTQLLSDFSKSDGQTLNRAKKAQVQSKKFSWAALKATSDLNSQGFNFLAEVRGFDETTIADLQARELVAIGKQNNLYFPWHDQTDKVVGADVQGTVLTTKGTHAYFKGVAAGSAHAHGWSMMTGTGKCERAVVFEGPLDAIAYYQMNRETLKTNPALLISLGGVQKLEVIGVALNEHLVPSGGHLKKLDIALDNDESGLATVELLKTKGLHSTDLTQVSVLTPTSGKDWNEELLNHDLGEQVTAIEYFKRQQQPHEDCHGVGQVKADLTPDTQPQKAVLWPKLSNFEQFITDNRSLLMRFSLAETYQIDKKVAVSDRDLVVTRQELRQLHLYPQNDAAAMYLERQQAKLPLFTLASFQNCNLHGKNQDMRLVASKRFSRLQSGWTSGRQAVYAAFKANIVPPKASKPAGSQELIEIIGQHLARVTLNLSAREKQEPFHLSVRQATLVNWSKMNNVEKEALLKQSQDYARALVKATKKQLVQNKAPLIQPQPAQKKHAVFKIQR